MTDLFVMFCLQLLSIDRNILATDIYIKVTNIFQMASNAMDVEEDIRKARDYYMCKRIFFIIYTKLFYSFVLNKTLSVRECICEINAGRNLHLLSTAYALFLSMRFVDILCTLLPSVDRYQTSE